MFKITDISGFERYDKKRIKSVAVTVWHKRVLDVIRWMWQNTIRNTNTNTNTAISKKVQQELALTVWHKELLDVIRWMWHKYN